MDNLAIKGLKAVIRNNNYITEVFGSYGNE